MPTLSDGIICHRDVNKQGVLNIFRIYSSYTNQPSRIMIDNFNQDKVVTNVVTKRLN